MQCPCEKLGIVLCARNAEARAAETGRPLGLIH